MFRVLDTIAIRNCIDKHPLLYLQRIYGKTLLKVEVMGS
jgi:hypothetical protein